MLPGRLAVGRAAPPSNRVAVQPRGRLADPLSTPDSSNQPACIVDMALTCLLSYETANNPFPSPFCPPGRGHEDPAARAVGAAPSGSSSAGSVLPSPVPHGGVAASPSFEAFCFKKQLKQPRFLQRKENKT